MREFKYPTVSILIVNFNGAHLLGDCLHSLENIDYQKDKLEIIVLDNDSKDNSVHFIKNNFPNIKIIESKLNLGFANGNNEAYKHSSGEYIVLLNTDTRVDKNWLKALVKCAELKNVGIVSSKLLLDTTFLELTIDSKIVSKSSLDNSIDFSPVGLIIEDIVCTNKKLNSLVWYESGFYEKKSSTISIHWCNDVGTVLLPIQNTVESYKLAIHGYPTTNDLATPITIKVANKVIFNDTIFSNQVKQIEFSIKKNEFENDLIYLVQNAGNIVLSDGYSKDRGSLIKKVNKDFLEFYERDSEHFQKRKSILAACGAACLIKRELINHVGFLDGTYFMYYEDTDLSLRAWRNGWDIYYEPEAIVYHKHKASTNAQSLQFFLFMVEKNHIAFVINHFPITTVVAELLSLFLRTGVHTIKYHILKFRDNIERTNTLRIKSKAQSEASKYIIKNIFHFFWNRLFWNSRAIRNYQEAKKYIY